MKRLRQLREHLGDRNFAIVTAVAVDDVSWRALGRRLGVMDMTAKAWAVWAINRPDQPSI